MQNITFNDLLTDPIYREMEYQEFHDLWHSDQISQQTVDYIYEKLGKPKGLMSHECWLHLQKLKAESEKKAEPIKPLTSKEFDKKFNKPTNIVFDSVFKANVKAKGSDINQVTKPEHPITITDQKAREIAAKYFNCNPNEIKII